MRVLSVIIQVSGGADGPGHAAQQPRAFPEPPAASTGTGYPAAAAAESPKPQSTIVCGFYMYYTFVVGRKSYILCSWRAGASQPSRTTGYITQYGSTVYIGIAMGGPAL